MSGEVRQQHAIVRFQQRRRRPPEAVIDRRGVKKNHARPAAAILIVEELAHLLKAQLSWQARNVKFLKKRISSAETLCLLKNPR
jgi:hypothetical protein